MHAHRFERQNQSASADRGVYVCVRACVRACVSVCVYVCVLSEFRHFFNSEISKFRLQIFEKKF